MEGSGAVCVVVQGPSGSGKSSLLREYAAIRDRIDGETLMVVHLGEQIDSKVRCPCTVVMQCEVVISREGNEHIYMY